MWEDSKFVEQQLNKISKIGWDKICNIPKSLLKTMMPYNVMINYFIILPIGASNLFQSQIIENV